MITTTDTANILYKVCKDFGMPVYQDGNVADGKIGKEGRVVIHVKEQTKEATWKKGFAEINLFAKDTKNGKADLKRLNELERLAHRILKGVGNYDGTVYKIELSSTAPLENKELESHFINARVLFKVLNTMD